MYCVLNRVRIQLIPACWSLALYATPACHNDCIRSGALSDSACTDIMTDGAGFKAVIKVERKLHLTASKNVCRLRCVHHTSHVRAGTRPQTFPGARGACHRCLQVLDF
jgi:hypothetical protein